MNSRKNRKGQVPFSRKKNTIFSAAERDAWRLAEPMTVSRWADENRILDERTSAEPGRWRTARTAYLAGPMDAFTDPEVEEITVQKVPQSGGTEAIYNMLGYTIDREPGPTLLTMPREDDCDYAAENRLRPMVMLSPALAAHTTGRIWDLSKNEFWFDRMTLYFAGSNSPAGLAAKPVRNLFLDETDKYPPFAGKEANPIDLAVKRTITFYDRKIVKISTPTTNDGYIHQSYLKSNMQQYYCPCPHCGEFTLWTFEQLKLPKELRNPDKIRKSNAVWYECPVCSRRIEENQKTQLVAAGKWVPAGQTIDVNGKIKGSPLRGKRHSGFQYSALLSPWVSWSQIMAAWFEANTEEGIALGKLHDFHNAYLGRPFEQTGRRLKASVVKELRSDFSCSTVPPDCRLLVASADYHKSPSKGLVRIQYEVRGFAEGLKNYVIKVGNAYSFDKLDEEVLASPFPWADGTSSEKRPFLAVMVLFIDSGYLPDDVYNYCRQRPGLTIPTQGETGPRRTPLTPSDIERATERRLNRRQRSRYRGMQLLLVDNYYFKNLVTGWVEPQLDEDGKVIAEPLTQFYAECPAYYFREFANEYKIRTRDSRGNTKWLWKTIRPGAPTHGLDTAVLAAAAAFYKGAFWMRGKKKLVLPAAAGRKKRIKLSELQKRKRGY